MTMRIGVFRLAIVAFFAGGPLSCFAAKYGDQLNPTGDPIGGGPGYRNIRAERSADFVVSERAELTNAIRKAQPGMVIYVRDDAVIDMTGADDQTIPGGVTLASGRGRGASHGALVYSDSLTEENKWIPLFKTGGKGVRITGLRLRGPFAEIGDHFYDQVKIANGIRADHENLEVDNCELWAWNKWAIDLAVAGGARVHHNYIHHTRRWGYGYGVWVRGGGRALIEANLFDACRHHIGSGSQADSSYEARYNICLDTSRARCATLLRPPRKCGEGESRDADPPRRIPQPGRAGDPAARQPAGTGKVSQQLVLPSRPGGRTANPVDEEHGDLRQPLRPGARDIASLR